MKTYPFSNNPKQNEFPQDENGSSSYIFKNENSLIEYDLDKLKKYFPKIKDQENFMQKINECIVRTN